jgi:hypothetical protein
MKKVYFASTDWATSQKLLEDYKYQTPNNLGIWEDLQGTSNIDEADIIIIQDYTKEKDKLGRFSKEQLIYFSREALDRQSIKNYPEDKYTHFSYWNNTGYLFTRWVYRKQGYGGTSKDYDELMSYQENSKTKGVCCILSDKEMCEGHSLRKNFAKDFLSKSDLHLYGEVNFRTHQLPDNDKYSTLKDYKYCLGFDNQDNIDNFFGTQFTDALLADCCPIFWCGTDLSNHFPEGSFIQIDIRKEGEVERVLKLLETDDFEKRKPAIKEAKNLILNKYNIWPTIKSIVK